MSKWPMAHFGDFAKEVSRPVSLHPGVAYQSVGVKWYGEGVHIHETRDGIDFNADRFEIRADDLIYNDMWARQGSVAIVPPDLSGAVASSHFPTFELNRDIVESGYLSWYFKTPSFWDACEEASRGSTGRNQIKRRTFFAISIPLPSIAEQQRIVARIESLAAKIGEARDLCQQAVQDEDRLLICMAHREDLSTNEKLRSGWFETTVGSICCFTDESELVDGSRSYPNLGIFSYGRGVFQKPSIEGVATSAQTLRRVRAGQFIYSRLFAFEGAYAMVPSELDGYYVSGEYPTFTCDPTKACAEFLWSNFRSQKVWQTVAVGSKGLGNRRQRVQPDRVLEYRLWVPPMEWQRKIQSVQAKVDALKKLQAETTAGLAALMPSILDKAFKGEL